MNLGEETIEQIKLFDWIRSREDLAPYCLHIANERQCSVQQGRLLRRMGVKRGTSDIFVGIARGGWHGMFIELKAGKNKPTESQEQFMADFSLQGYYCIWAVGYEKAKKAIIDYLAEPESRTFSVQ